MKLYILQSYICHTKKIMLYYGATAKSLIELPPRNLYQNNQKRQLYTFLHVSKKNCLKSWNGIVHQAQIED